MPPASRLLLVAALVATPALAEGGISLAVASAKIGVDPVAGMRVSPTLGGHGDATLLAVSRHFQSGHVADADHLKLRSAVAMIDLFPFGNALRLSAGARYESTQAPLGLVSAFPGPARAVAGWTSVGPTVTLGWTRRFGHGLVAVLEGGTMLRRDVGTALATVRASPIAQMQLGLRF